jgi:hypothetical protein
MHWQKPLNKMKTKQIIFGVLILALSIATVILTIKSFNNKPTPAEIRTNQTNQENEKIANDVDTMSDGQLWGIIGTDFDSAAAKAAKNGQP